MLKGDQRKGSDLLKGTLRSIGSYLDEAKCECLVCGLLETMRQKSHDIDIAINYTDSVRSSALQSEAGVVFLPFLLGVPHYVVMNCPDYESGRPAFGWRYSQSSPTAELKFNSALAKSSNR